MVVRKPIRSFVCRNSRLSDAQSNAHSSMWPEYGLTLTENLLDFSRIFNRSAPTHLEIGFGSGHSLLAAAQQFPEKNFIGIETHLPGIGSLLLGIKKLELKNIRIFNADAVDVIKKAIPDKSLSALQLFFPDPWPKRKHHKRRLVQPDFIKLICSKLCADGELHFGTDWEHYAQHMMRVLSAEPLLINCSNVNNFSSRSPYRPVITKFEQRAIKEGRKIWDLRFSINK